MNIRHFTMLFFLFLFAACATHEDISMVYAGATTELSKKHRQALIAAATAYKYRPGSEFLEQALQQQDIEKIYVDYSAATIYYALISVSDTRTFEPIVLCSWKTDPLVWNYCRDESHMFAILPERKPIVISEEISDDQLHTILAFIEAAELLSPKRSPVLAENVYKVQTVEHRYAGKSLRVLATTPAEEYATIRLRPLSDGQLETFEITDFVCDSGVPSELKR